MLPAIVSHWSPASEAVVLRRRGSGGKLSWAEVPFSSMSRFSLLQIDVEVEEPETSESFEIKPVNRLSFFILRWQGVLSQLNVTNKVTRNLT
jgi:hypothetical protein